MTGLTAVIPALSDVTAEAGAFRVTFMEGIETAHGIEATPFIGMTSDRTARCRRSHRFIGGIMTDGTTRPVMAGIAGHAFMNTMVEGHR